MDKKRNYSKKREAILAALRSTDCHPTAEWLYRTLKSQYPDLSLGTVYRNLAQFREEGLIISVGVVNGQERFDANVRPHAHFICSRCGAVIDVPGVFVSGGEVARAARRAGLQVKSCEIVLHGVCTACLEKQAQRAEKPGPKSSAGKSPRSVRR